MPPRADCFRTQKVLNIAYVSPISIQNQTDLVLSLNFRRRVPQAWQACNSMWQLWKCPTLSQDCKRTLFRATIGTVLLYNAETWTTTRALERRIDGVYTRLLRKPPNVLWQLHMTNKELYHPLWTSYANGAFHLLATAIDVKISLSNIWSCAVIL